MFSRVGKNSSMRKSDDDMTDFQRTRSKVWFPSLDDDDEDVAHYRPQKQQQQKQQQQQQQQQQKQQSDHHHHHHMHSWRRQPSSSPESRRVSSGSPSNGSHRSQDSGFSDSESGGSPPSRSSGGPPRVGLSVSAAACSFGDRSLDDGPLLADRDDSATATRGILSSSRLGPSAEPCDCFLPACELSRKFRSYQCDTPATVLSPFAANGGSRYAEEPRTPNRTCFIVDELPKSGGAVPVVQQPSTPSFDGNFDRSENVTVVEKVRNVSQDEDDDDDRQLIIDPPTPFVDCADDVHSLCDGLDAPPEHTSTPKSTKNRCCTPKLHYKKQLQLRKPQNASVDRRTERENEIPVGQWLNELRFKCEPECMTTLQSKSIATSEDVCRISTMIVCTDSEVVRDLYHRTKAVSDEFKRVYNDLNKCRNDNFGPSVQTLTGLLLDFVGDYETDLPENGQELCMDLVDVAEKLRIHANRRLGNRKIILNDVSALGQIFSELVDTLLMKRIQSLVNVLEEPSTDVELIKAMSSINNMGLESFHLSGLVTKCNGIRSLLAVCLDAVSSTVRSAALRTLATVCCTSDSIGQFEKAGGVDVLSDVLGSGYTRSEKELADAVSVLVQITAPCVQDNHVIDGLGKHLETFISSLTHLVETTRSSETLLLSAAALANVTSVEPNAVWTVLNMGTAGCLIEAVRRNGTASSVFLQEQTATLLANMSAVPETRPHMAANRAVVALLCFLQVRHSPLQPVPEILAAERLQHKAAIALSRLCSDAEVSKQVAELEGVNRLIRLCKDERERNHSDGVLVACLASLRKIAANCGKDNMIMDRRDVAELIEPRLLDSFLLYSSKQESYV